MRVIANPRHPADSVPSQTGSDCKLIVAWDSGEPRVICVNHNDKHDCSYADHDYIDVTSKYYDRRTGHLRG
jgi:hypothetical protein